MILAVKFSSDRYMALTIDEKIPSIKFRPLGSRGARKGS
jgi:hypothetical protein